jgi:hypothetical protein
MTAPLLGFNSAFDPLFLTLQVCPFFEFRELNKNDGPKKDWQKKEKEKRLHYPLS